MELLIFLVGDESRWWSREDIVKKLWRSDCLSTPTGTSTTLFEKFGPLWWDDSARPRFLETVVGKGYRFIGPVRVIDANMRALVSDRHLRARLGWRMRANGERMSLAVLPLLLLVRPRTIMACAWGSQMHWSRVLEICRCGCAAGFPVLKRATWGQGFGDRFALGVVFRSWAPFKCRKANRVFRWKCLTRTHRVLVSREKRDLEMNRLSDLENEPGEADREHIEAAAGPAMVQQRPRHSRDPLAYAEFMRGYRLSASGDPVMMEKSHPSPDERCDARPCFCPRHATLSFACTTRHFEFDPASVWLEKAESTASVRLNRPGSPRRTRRRAFLLWGPSKKKLPAP